MGSAQDCMLAVHTLSGDADQIAKDAADALKLKKVTLIELVKSVGDFVTNEDANVRSRGICYLSAVLKNAGDDYLSRQQSSVLAEFFSARIQDEGSLPALEYLQSLPRFSSELAVNILRALGENFNDMQVLPQSRRFEVFRLINQLMQNHRTILRRMEDQSIQIIVDLSSGEKDPRNLMIVFSIMRAIMVEWDISRHVDSLFESVFCYFPITFRPPPNDPYGITAQDLKERLRDCISSNARFAPFVFPQLIDKLDSTSVNVKRDVLQAIRACAESYDADTLSAYSIALWDSLKFEILADNDKELSTETLLTLASIASSLATVNTHDQVHGNVLNSLMQFLKPVLKEAQQHLEEAQQKQASGVSRILRAVAGSSATCFSVVVKAILPAIIRLYGQAPSMLHRKGLLEALMQVFEAGRPYQGSQVVTDIASDTLVGPFKDQTFAILSQALMGTSKDEVSFRILALRCLQASCSYSQLFSDTEVTLVVRHLHDLLLVPSFDDHRELQEAAIEALRDIASSRRHLILDITLPHLLAILPSMERPTDRSYLPALEALSRIGTNRNLSDTVIRRLFNRLESIISLPDTSHYVRALLLTLAHIVFQDDLQLPQFTVDYLKRSFSLVHLAAEASLGKPIATSLVTAENLNILSKIVCSILASAPILDQQAAGHQIYALFTGASIYVAPGASDTVTAERKKTIFLSTALIAGIDRRLGLPYSSEELSDLINHTVQLAAQEQDAVIKHGLHQHVCLLINKFVPTSDLSQLQVVTWMTASPSERTLHFELTSSSLQAAFWVAKALVLRLVHVENILESLLYYLATEELGAICAHGFAMLLRPDAIVSKENGATIRLLAAQKVMTYVLPRIVSKYTLGGDAVKVNCLVALSGLLADVRSDISQYDIEDVFPLLIQSLELDDYGVRSATLETLTFIIKEAPRCLDGYVSSLLRRFETVMGDRSAENAESRIIALSCMGMLSGALARDKAVVFRELVMCVVSKSLDDPRRNIRKGAVDSLQAWANFDEPNVKD